MRKISIAVVMLSLGLLLSTSNAFGFALIDPLTGESYLGQVEIKFDNWDFGTIYAFNEETGKYDAIPAGQSLTPGVPVAGDGVIDSYGVASVTSILRDPQVGGGAPANTLWTPSLTEGLEIAFSGLDDILISADGLHLWSTAGGGAYLRVYLDTTPDMDPTTGIAGFPNNVGNAGDTLFLDCVWVAGVDPSVPTAVYQQALSFAGANPPFGSGEGYLAVVGGTYKDLFDTNGFLGGLADLHLKSSFNPDFSQAWTVLSHDPVKGAVTPEPTSMLLIGAGMLGLAAKLRKKRA